MTTVKISAVENSEVRNRKQIKAINSRAEGAREKYLALTLKSLFLIILMLFSCSDLRILMTIIPNS